MACCPGARSAPSDSCENALNASDTRFGLAVKDVKIALQGIAADPRLPRLLLGVPRLQYRYARAQVPRVAQFEREQAGKHPCGRSGVRVSDLVGQGAGRVSRPPCRVGMAEEPQRVPESGHANHFGVLSVPHQMRAAMLGAVLLHGRLKVSAGGSELTLPEGGNPEHIGALHEQHVVAVPRGARAEALPEFVRLLKRFLRESGERQRPQQGWLRLDAKLPCEHERALLHLDDAARLVSFAREQQRGQGRQDGELACLATRGIR